MISRGDDDHHRWMQFYHQQTDPQADPATDHPLESEFFDPTATEPGNKPGQRALSGSPRGALSPKPIRRRSRASKRTPTTVLNANTNNFRALVQQFTGCPSTAISFKGPVNLSFASNYNRPDHTAAAPLNNNYGTYATTTCTSALLSTISSSYGQQRQQQPDHRVSSLFSFGNSASNTNTGGYVSGMELEASVSLDEGFGAIDGNSSGQGLAATPDSFSW